MNSQKKFVKLIAYLIELTQKKEIKWQRDVPPDSIMIGYSNNVDLVYTTIFEDKILRIHEEYFKVWNDDISYEWDNMVILEFIDGMGRTLWRFPQLPGLWDLLEAVRYQEAGVADFISNIISKHKLDE